MFNPIECYCTEKFQYTLIHKNGCSSILNAITNNYEYYLRDYVTPNIPLFVVIRDPWERTISGLSYDLYRTYGDIDENILDDIDFKKLFYHPVNKIQRTTGFLSHISVQIGYLFDIQPSFYVDLKDLTSFLRIHFGNVSSNRINEGSKEFKDKLINALSSRPDIKDTIEKYLAIDYYFIDRIRNTEILWDFSMGKMW